MSYKQSSKQKLNATVKNRTGCDPEINYINQPIRVAVLIDGGYFIKRYNYNWNKKRTASASDVANHLYTLAHNHIGKENYLYRISFTTTVFLFLKGSITLFPTDVLFLKKTRKRYFVKK